MSKIKIRYRKTVSAAEKFENKIGMDHFKSNVAGYYKKREWNVVRIIFERTSVEDELFLRFTIFQSKF